MRQRPRWRLQFRLRTALGVMSLCALVFAPAGYFARSLFGRPLLVPVGGTLTFKGQPVAGATVSFINVDSKGQPAYGVTDLGGEFRLCTYRSAMMLGVGAEPGEYRVIINTTAKTSSKVPLRYTQPATSGLRAKVTAVGANNFSLNTVD